MSIAPILAAPILTARGLHKSYGPDVVLDGVTLSFHDDERVGLVGINGSGKSTLARVLAGVESPDAGELSRRRDADVMYLAQEPMFEPGARARDVVASGLAAWSAAVERHTALSSEIEREGGTLERVEAQSEAALAVERLGGWDRARDVNAMLSRLGIEDGDRSVDTMSGGERRRVDLARILVARPALAILDEPTNHLDVDTIEWLERYLENEHGGALLLITHDRYVLDRVVTRTIELDRGTVYSYPGGWGAYLEAKAERLAHEARAEANRQNFLRRELEWLRRQPKARTGKQKARIDRANEAIAAAPKRRHEEVRKLELMEARAGSTVLELRGLSVERGDNRLVEGLDLIISRGERIGVVGRNGAGKSSLLHVLRGELEPTGGERIVGKNARFAYLDQARADLDEDASILENVAGSRRTVELHGREVDVRGWLGGFLFSADKQRAKVGTLSGGERARVAVARLLLAPANVLLLDEPTNDLDVTTLGALEDMLLESRATAIVVTHDRYFLDRVATSILAFEGDGRVVRYAGDYSMYRATRAAREEAARSKAAAEAAPGPRPSTDREKPARRGLTYAERLELESLMDKVGAAEDEVARIEGELAEPSLYAERGDAVPELTAELDEARTALERLVARWEELEQKREESM